MVKTILTRSLLQRLETDCQRMRVRMAFLLSILCVIYPKLKQ